MDILAFRTFVTVVDEQSFSTAAQRLGISRSQCSKHVADLEAELGVRLLTRTTRKVTPTELGRAYSNSLRDALGRLDDATDAVRAAAGTASGTIKIGSPVFYAFEFLQPRLLRFMDQFPDIHLSVVLDDATNDIVAEGFDAVIRIGNLRDSTLFARPLHSMRVLIVASPAYLEAHGIPKQPRDLMKHACLHYSNLPGARTWPLQQGSELIHQRVHPILSSNSIEFLHMMAVNGRGITLVPEPIVRNDLKEGRLCAILQDYTLPELPVSLLYPSGRMLSGAMRSFLDFMTTGDDAPK